MTVATTGPAGWPRWPHLCGATGASASHCNHGVAPVAPVAPAENNVDDAPLAPVVTLHAFAARFRRDPVDAVTATPAPASAEVGCEEESWVAVDAWLSSEFDTHSEGVRHD
jgi:hypothetical protein